MKARNKMRLWAAVYLSLLMLYTLYVLLDAFVIERRFVVVEPSAAGVAATEEGMQANATEAPVTAVQPSAAAAPVQTDTSYQDERIGITLLTYREYDTTIYVADVVLADASHLMTAFAGNVYGRNVTERAAVIAEAQGAILSINGDNYGAQRNGYVIRNGVLYRDAHASDDQEVLCIWPDGSFTTARSGDVSAAELLESGAVQVFSFGPALIRDGAVAVAAGQEINNIRSNSNPRTAIAMIEPLHYLFVVSDGRTDESAGLSLYALAEFLYGLGAREAYNLDGGGSSTMVFQGRVINYPTTRGSMYSERAVSDIVYVK